MKHDETTAFMRKTKSQMHFVEVNDCNVTKSHLISLDAMTNRIVDSVGSA